MNIILKIKWLTIFLLLAACSFGQRKAVVRPKEVYKSATLVITQVANNSFQHTSFLQTNDFGNVPCNGLIVQSGNETIIFDTPTNDTVSAELIKWINDSLHCKIKAIVPTHFHNDCLGGLKAFHDNKIPSYAYFKTITLAKQNNYTIPQKSFTNPLTLTVGKSKVIVKYFGEGHTKDNVVAYFDSDDILFGGCLIKEIDASKGYLGDANVAAWSATVEKVKKAYPNLRRVIPGHGDYGGPELLDYTIELFRKTGD